MANFEAKELNFSDINNGVRYQNGDIPDSEAINAPIEASVYAQKLAQEASVKAETALNMAWGSQTGNYPAISAYPIGTPFFTNTDIDPAEIFGGEWELILDRTIVGAGNKYAVRETGGSADAVVVEHDHQIQATYSTTGTASAESTSVQGVNDYLSSYSRTQKRGEDGTGKNMPPYYAMYIWLRIA